MMENNGVVKENYREKVNQLGKKEFTLLKMQEYGFWPKNLPTPYERQANESPEDYAKRRVLLKNYEKIIEDITKLYEEKDSINAKLRDLEKKYDETWDYEKIRLDIAQEIFKESIARRAERKKEREKEKAERSQQWEEKKADNIVYIGKGYSKLLHQLDSDKGKLLLQGLPVIENDKELAQFLGIEYKELRFLTYHRDVVTMDHYHRYTVPKRNGGLRNIAAPKPLLKASQKRILEEILCRVPVSGSAHGFLKDRSVVTGAVVHGSEPELLINMDLENFFPTITFERVRGMFKAFGYSGYISSLLAMVCTYCDRMEIEIKGETKYVATSKRILPQGSPASPMITNILCIRLDRRLKGLADKHSFIYTRYADDMSFSLKENANAALEGAEKKNCEDMSSKERDSKKKSSEEISSEDIRKFLALVSKIVAEEGFKINKEKTKFLRKNNRQCITGVVINNQQLGVPKKWVKNLRAAIYNANKIKNTGSVPQKSINEISGMIAWLKTVNCERYKDIIEAGMEVIKDNKI